jgi:hypothetical protein
MEKKAKMFQHLRAENSPNGNPQRVFVMISDDGRILNVVDEGYQGLPKACRGLVELPSINISKADYHDYIRIGREKSGAR